MEDFRVSQAAQQVALRQLTRQRRARSMAQQLALLLTQPADVVVTESDCFPVLMVPVVPLSPLQSRQTMALPGMRVQTQRQLAAEVDKQFFKLVLAASEVMQLPLQMQRPTV